MSTLANDPNITAAIARVRKQAFIVGLAGLAICAACALLSQDLRVQFFRSYLWAFTFWLGIPLGCMVVLMIHHLTGGTWGFALRRLLEAATRTLPMLAVLFVPLTFGLQDIYLWANKAAVADDPNLQHKAEWYLRPDLVIMRVPVYFAVWIGISFCLNRWSRREEKQANPSLPHAFRLLSAGGLGLYGLTVTFASIDWVMSLEPHWYSTIYGPMFGMGQVLAGFSFAVATALLLRNGTPLGEVMTKGVLRDCGNLMLAFIMVWTYLSFSQFLLMWSGNLPEEAPWYLARSRDGWQVVTVALFLFHFVLPFLLLLSREFKENPRRLASVAFLLLAMEAVNLFWLIMPAFGAHEEATSLPNPGSFGAYILNPAALIGVGGIWLSVFLWQLGREALLPSHAPEQEAAGHD